MKNKTATDSKEHIKPKPLFFVGNARKELLEFPDEVRGIVGYSLYAAQCGKKHPDVKPLSGFGNADVLEIVESDLQGTYRTVYTVKFGDAIYVLCAFQKKSKKGISTPPRDMDLIRSRLALATEAYANCANEK